MKSVGAKGQHSWAESMSHFITSHLCPWAAYLPCRWVHRDQGSWNELTGRAGHCAESRQSWRPGSAYMLGDRGPSSLQAQISTRDCSLPGDSQEAPCGRALVGSSWFDENQMALGSARDRCLRFHPTPMPPRGAVWSRRDLRGFFQDSLGTNRDRPARLVLSCAHAWTVRVYLKERVKGKTDACLQWPQNVTSVGVMFQAVGRGVWILQGGFRDDLVEICKLER